MRTLDSDSYYRFVRGEATVAEAVEALFRLPSVSTLRPYQKRGAPLIISANRKTLRETVRDGMFQAGSDTPSRHQPLYSASYQWLCRITIGALHSREMPMEDANQYSSVRPFITDMKIDAVPVPFQFRVPFAPI